MRITSILKTSFFVVPAFLAAAPAVAGQQPEAAAQEQAAQPADPNAIHGSIQVCEAARGEHRVQLEGGRRYSITATSEGFDPFLRLLRPGSEEPIAEDDDSGGGTVPRIVYSPAQSGEYVVRVSSFAPGGAGNYSLSVTPQAPLPALVSRPTRTERGQWQVFQGDLSDRDPVEEGRRFDDYDLRLAAGETAMLHVQAAEGVDTVLQVFTADGRGVTPVATDDDGGGGTNPFLFFAPEEAGNYVVRVIGFAEDTRGAYRLRVGR
jgi:hypothetical protein